MSDFRDLSSNFAVFPQLSLEQVKIASDQGFKMIVCNRPDGEDPGQLSAAQIASACQDVGLDFVHIPVSGGPNEDNVMAMKQALTQHAGPVLA